MTAGLAEDVRYAARGLVKSPGFTLAALLSLAIGIGANTALFSVVNALLLRPVPYQDPDRLVVLWNRSPGLGITEDWFSTAQYFDIKNAHTGFEQLAIAFGTNMNLTGDGEPERVGTIRVSSSFLPMLGARAAMGRIFVPEEDAPGRAPTAVLTHGIWVRRYGSDQGIVGRRVILNGQPFEVVGVLPQSFSLPREMVKTLYGGEFSEIVLPLPLSDAAPRARDREDYNIVGKLRRGTSIRQAQAEMDVLTARLRQDHPELYPPNGGLTFSIVPMLEEVVGGIRLRLYILLGAVGFVLLVAAANVANLMLARALARRKEIAVRVAFGASRGRLIRQLLTESVLLALCGGAAGALFAAWSLAWLRSAGPSGIPRLADIGIDARVLLFTLLVSALTGILFGLVPALRTSRIELNTALKEAGRGAASGGAVWGRGHNTRRLLVVTELALSVVLLIGAGLLIRSFAGLQKVEPGFNPGGLLTFGLQLSGAQYGARPAVLETYRELWERLERIPGVTAAGGTSSLPLTQSYSWTPITVEGRTPPPGERFVNADARIASGRYFEAMQIPLRKGRLFDERDTADTLPVVIIDERLADEFWPGGDAVGKRINQGMAMNRSPWMTIVGVVGRVKHDSLDSDPRVAFYMPHTQAATRALTVVVRCATDAAAMTAAVKEEVRAVDAGLPLYAIRTMDDLVGQSLARHRFSALLFGVFAAFALALASIGIFGVLAYLVGQGAREIGIRIALGATASGVLGMVVRQGLTLACIGVGAGLVLAFAVTRFMSSLLFGISATDTVTFAAVPALLLVVALVASYAPARRAARVDPVVTLRYE